MTEMMEINLNMYHAVALGAVMFWLGNLLTDRISVLNRFCIPAPLVGGLCFALVNTALYAANIMVITFDDTLQTVFMTMFFTTVGYTVSLPALFKGGKSVLLLLGLIVLGWRFAATIVIGSVAFPAFLGIFQSITALHTLLDDPLYAAICAGVLEGMGLGMIIRAGGSSGGSDVIPIILNRKFRIPIAPTLYAIDVAIIAAQLPSSDLEAAVLSGIYATLYTVVMNRVILLGHGNVQFQIFSEHNEEIAERLLEMDRGVTLLHGRTGLRRQECDVVLCVVPIRWMNEVKRAAISTDPNAFITVSSVRDVSGRGYTIKDDDIPYAQLKKMETRKDAG